ncbi:MAG: NAD(P)/FAD-dependent oxidoreductase [Clostridia bacterium]|nr:NAD(P)/FAD-dependent oxidoreductase [Clostridia bacterium]
MRKVLVIGGGAAGLIAAGAAARRGYDVTVLERNQRPARKVMITGKGRCNLTNYCTSVPELIANVPTNGRFLYGAFSRFMPADMMTLIEDMGVPLKIERGNRVFPVSDKAVDIVDALVRYAKSGGARIVQGRAASFQMTDGCVNAVQCADGKIFSADAFILATGGKSYPLTGSVGDGYRLAQQAGHMVIPPHPSLVPFVLAGEDYKALQGVSLKNIAIAIKDAHSGKTVYEDFGEMLFTHFGVSGPVILSASAAVKDVHTRTYTLSIDLKPALDEETLDKRILRELEENRMKTLTSVVLTLVPHALVPLILKRANIPGDAKAHAVTKKMRTALIKTLKSLDFTITGTRSFDEAIVTSGGISVKDIDPKTMRSKICDNLFFAGEVIDVDAFTGGFNLQIAFSTGMCAGNNV